jgi:S-formylglutathione hydrolase FrmB
MNSAANQVTRLALALAALIVLAVSSPAASAAAGRAECRQVNSKILGYAVPYCAFLPPSYDSDPSRKFPVVYFLHGLGENEQVLLESGGWQIIEDAWSQKTLGEFVIVAPAAGRTFYINSRDGKVRYEDFFIKEFLPAIEGNYRVRGEKRSRGVTGISMGGYGALRFAFKYPQLFAAVSAHSAALIERPPDIKITPQQQGAISRLAGTAFGNPFDRAYWDRESPFTIVRDSPKPVGLKIYFDCGTEDGFGFNAGAQEFHDLLQTRGIPHEFHLYPGGHTWMYFATHFPDSLEFQANAIAPTATKAPAK